MHVSPFAGRAAGSCPHLGGCHRFPAYLCWLVLSLPWEECHIPEKKQSLKQWVSLSNTTKYTENFLAVLRTIYFPNSLPKITDIYFLVLLLLHFFPPFSSISCWKRHYWCSWVKKSEGRIHMINTIALHCHLESHITPTHPNMHKRDQWCVTEDWTWWEHSAELLHLIPPPSLKAVFLSFCYLLYSPFPLARCLCLILNSFLAPQFCSLFLC